MPEKNERSTTYQVVEVGNIFLMPLMIWNIAEVHEAFGRKIANEEGCEASLLTTKTFVLGALGENTKVEKEFFLARHIETQEVIVFVTLHHHGSLTVPTVWFASGMETMDIVYSTHIAIMGYLLERDPCSEVLLCANVSEEQYAWILQALSSVERITFTTHSRPDPASKTETRLIRCHL